MRTHKLFNDLLQFHTQERSQPEIILSQDSIVSNNSPNYSASFIPAISQKNFKSNDSIHVQGKFVNVVQDESQGPWSTSLLNKQNYSAENAHLSARLRKGENVKLPVINSPASI